MPYPLFGLAIAFLLAIPTNLAADDTTKLQQLFSQREETEGTTVLTIPPGDYLLDGKQPITLRSNLTVHADGARFILPAKLDDQARLVLFRGENIRNFFWNGGHFVGNVFDPENPNNTWPPNANTRGIVITTTTDGGTSDLDFRHITSSGMAGAVVTVLGASKEGNEREILAYAKNVRLLDCNLERSGKFMWDYGYLWQILIWPEDYDDQKRAMALKYFRNDLVRDNVRFQTNDDRIYVDNQKRLQLSEKRFGLDADRGYDSVCFFGERLPSNLKKGRQYFVVDSQPEFIRVSETVGGPAIVFREDIGAGTRLITNNFQSHLALYAPLGSGPGKGAFDFEGCKNVVVQGCRLSALGDTMHIQKCDGVVFSGNQITGSRMGAFFLAEYCRNATITGNTVDGTNGSRVISVEKSCEDVVISGNTFRGGGRGSWINQPRNLILSNNIFINNTTKCEADPKLGRRSFLTGDYERYPEVYFTTYEPQGRYGNIVIEGNIFVSGPNASHAITFAPGGDNIHVVNNTFAGPIKTIPEPIGCTAVTIRDNPGLPRLETSERDGNVQRVTRIPNLVAFWDFVSRETDGERRFIAHVPVGSPTQYPLDAANYIKEYWGAGRAASYADFPLLGRGPFGNAIRIVKESDADFRPFLYVPRSRLHDTPLDIKGANKSVSVVAWAIRESGNHAIAGI